ncbi:MAG: FHA domain-containing protein [Bdellovibrionales bacterium]|nr:FHA domain-containing protein [Bdellovibrionales bacterium]
MWAIRFLNGKLAGQEIPLQEGKYILGRSDDCQITIPDPGISKKHAELEIDEQGAIIVDLQSSNGTFLNGVQVQESANHNKDKVSLCQTTFDIVRASKQSLAPTPFHPHLQGGMPPAHPQALAHYGGGYPPPQHALQQMPSIDGQAQQDPSQSVEEPVKLTLKNWCKNYMDKVVLPGVYKLPVWLEFKWVIASIMIFFVATMTCLSAIPLIQILNSSVTQESMNHAESIATTLARMNYETIKNQMHSAASVEYALRRPGVVKAFIIKAESGKIIAPAEQTHTYSKIPFVNEGRRKEGNSIKKIDSNTVAAMVPIQFYNKKTNAHSAEAYSVVIYKMGTLAMGKTISLLVQTCFIALVLGVFLFFFLYKMIEYPIVSLNKQLSSALKDDSLSVQTDYDFIPLQNLTDNINSALSRISAAQESNQNKSEYDRMTEMNHLIEMIGYPTLGIDMESMKVQAASALFEEETGVSAERILNCLVQDIDDQALKLNLSNLLERVQQYPHEMASDSLEFSGVEFQLSAKGVYGKEGLAYTLISFIQMNQEQEQAG